MKEDNSSLKNIKEENYLCRTGVFVMIRQTVLV